MRNTMKAVVFHGENNIRVENRAIPTIIQATDVIVKLTKTTICGTDLGIWKGKNPEIEVTVKKKYGRFNGRILGHEGIGIIEECGEAVKNFKKGDKVIISCISRCSTCKNCQKQLYSHCINEGGWILGYMIDGTQAEYVRIPFADTSLYLLPDNLNENIAVMLSDLLPTAHEIGVQNGNIKPGNTVAIIGAGPIGMGCILTAQFYSPEYIIVVDIDENRLSMAKRLGAKYIINTDKEDTIQKILTLTDGCGVDCAIEAVGIEKTWNICQNIVKEGGHIANVGVHSTSVKFLLEKLWIKNLTITTGLVNTNTTEMLMKICCSNKLPIEKLATHQFSFSKIEKAYDVFKHASYEKAIKVIINY